MGIGTYTSLSKMLLDVKNVEDIGISHIKNINETTEYSYKSIHILALKFLHMLKASGLQPQDELIVLSTDKELGFIIFWACVYGGIRIVFGNNNENSKEQFINFSKLCSRPFFITDNINYYKVNFDGILSDRMLLMPNMEELERYSPDENLIFPAKEDDIAAIIFSSGSIKEPKGVSITHKNASSFASALSNKMGLCSKDISLTWMPLGTITDFMVHHIVPLYNKCQQYHLNNQLFVKMPFYLCELLSNTKTTFTTLINSMFPVISSYASNQEYNWSLSNVRYIFVGAEPVTEKASTDFLLAMEKYGLNKNCLKPGYGLSETMSAATVLGPECSISMLTIDDTNMNIGNKISIISHMQKHAHTYVSVGTCLKCVQISITDEQGKSLSPGYIGIIKIKGDTVSCGYYGIETLIKDKNGWFDTGDIGFLDNNHLYIVGRYKDMFIVNGKNYYYNDLEHKLSLIVNMNIHDITLACVDNINNTDIHELICFLKWDNLVNYQLYDICQNIKDFCLNYYALKANRFCLLYTSS